MKERLAKAQLALHLRKLQMQIPEVRAFLDDAIEWGQSPSGDAITARLRSGYRLPRFDAALRGALVDALAAEGGLGGLWPTASRKRRAAERLVALFERIACVPLPAPGALAEAEAAREGEDDGEATGDISADSAPSAPYEPISPEPPTAAAALRVAS